MEEEAGKSTEQGPEFETSVLDEKTKHPIFLSSLMNPF